jgi:hypothetical protein
MMSVAMHVSALPPAISLNRDGQDVGTFRGTPGLTARISDGYQLSRGC